MNVINDVVIFIIDSILCFLIFILFYYIVILVCCVSKLVYFVFIKPMINKFKKHIKKLNGENKMSNTQTVYKIEKGDLVGDIKGDNIIVILMNGDVNGDISSKEGDVVLIKGDINGDVKANKVICQQPKSDYENYIDKLSSVEKLSKPDKKDDEIHCVCAKPNTNCAKCAWYDYVSEECKSWDANEGECHFIDKNEMERSHDDFVKNFKNFCQTAPSDYVNCADCVYGEKHNIAGKDYYRCPNFGLMQLDTPRLCDMFKEKKRNTTCKSCYHFVKGAKTNDYYCSKRNLEKLPNSDLCCQYYDGTGETTKYKLDCARASNNSGLCLFFCVSGCPIKNGCPYKVNRSENG